MMHKKLVSFVKHNKLVLTMYRLFGNFFIAFLKCFVRVNNKKILFMSFGGQKYDDSPRALYEQMKKDPFFKDYKFIWGFTRPEKFNVDCKKVKVDTVRFYIAALSSKIWINNSSVERGLKLARKKTIEINSWHGTPLKKMGDDIHDNHSFKSRRRNVGKRMYCSQSEYDQEIFTRLFRTTKEDILISDLPRNDALLKYTDEEKVSIKDKLNIPGDKKVILYAPTYREFNRDRLNACYIKPPVDFSMWQQKLGEKYVLLFRAHYEVVKVLGIETNSFVLNVSDYPYLNDLMVISDLVISDYSSIYFDYSILEKPMLNFSYDIEEYSKIRGLYLDINQELGCNVNLDENALIEEILSLDEEKYIEYAKKFKQKFAPNAGFACDTVINKIKDLIRQEKI